MLCVSSLRLCHVCLCCSSCPCMDVCVAHAPSAFFLSLSLSLSTPFSAVSNPTISGRLYLAYRCAARVGMRHGAARFCSPVQMNPHNPQGP